jgi:hypothetical protein
LRETGGFKNVFAFTSNRSESVLGKVLVPSIDWQIGDPLSLLSEMNLELDAVVSILPMATQSKKPLKTTTPNGKAVELCDDLGNLLLAAASMRLNPTGIGLFVVTPSFFATPGSVFPRLGELGLGIEAAFALPAGTFAPFTNIPAYLVLVRRKPIEKMFVAQLSGDENTNREIISNYNQGRTGGALESGRFVESRSFKNLNAIRVTEMFELAEGRFGAPAITLGELSSSIIRGKFGPEFVFNSIDNSIFVPLIGNTDVLETVNDLTLKNQNYAQVVIDSTQSSARFVAHFLNSSLGRELRDLSKTGVVIPKLNAEDLKSLRVLIPNLQTQHKMLELEAGIVTQQNTVHTLQNELGDLQRELWTNPRDVNSVELRLNNLSKKLASGIKQHTEGMLEQWFETLPFPLASILRAWQASPSNDFKTKYEHLLHFFEGTAEFIGVILLSAFSSNEVIFEPHKKTLADVMKKQHLSFQRATFGTWKLVVEYLGKQTRELLSENSKQPDVAANDLALCADIFADASLSLPEVLSHKELAGILSATNKMRNDWSGHSGVVGQVEAQHRNELLLAEVQRLHETIADTWLETQLVQALQCRSRCGIFETDIAILMGSNNEFLKETREMSTCLDVDRIYLSKRGSGRSLKLLPLVRVGPSPQSVKNACYFFNRLEPDGARFISYHYTDEPELKGLFVDAAAAIELLTQS